MACDHVQWSCKHVYLTVRVQGGESAARRAWSGEYRAALLGRRRWGGVAAAHLLHGCALRHCVAEVGPLGLLGVLVRLVLRLLQLGLHTRLLALCEVALLVRLRLRLPLELLLLAQVLPPLRQQLEHVGRLRLRVGFLHGGPRVVACRSGGASVRRCRRCLSEAPREARQATPRYHATTLTSCGSGPLRCGGATRALGVATRRAARHRRRVVVHLRDCLPGDAILPPLLQGPRDRVALLHVGSGVELVPRQQAQARQAHLEHAMA